MKKTGTLKSKCACGSEITFHFIKPKSLQVSVSKSKCEGCESYYMLMGKYSRNKNIEVDLKALNITPKLRRLIMDKGGTANEI